MATGIPFVSIYPDGPVGSAAAAADASGTGPAADPWPGLPAGATPVERDLVVTVADPCRYGHPPPTGGSSWCRP